MSWISPPKQQDPPKIEATQNAEVNAQMAAEQERARKRKGRSSTIIAGLYGNQNPSQKELLGG